MDISGGPRPVLAGSAAAVRPTESDRLSLSDTSLGLEDALLLLSKFGNPSVSRRDSGWHCRMDVFVTGSGVQFQVMTEFKELTPRHAVAECSRRLGSALASLGR